MTFPPSLAELQELAAAKVGRDCLSGAEVRELAARYGIKPRTLRHYGSEGLVAASTPMGRRGQSRGVEFRYPARALVEIELIAEARKATHSLSGIRHWLWWVGYPIDWARWRADRLGDLAAMARWERVMVGISRDQRDHAAAQLAAELGKRRPFPLRRHALRTEPRRELVAQWVLDGRFGSIAPDPAETVEERGDGTAGDVLDRLVGLPLRRSGWLGPGSVGAQVAELLVTAPTFGESLRRFELLTEAEARKWWRIAAGSEAAGLARAIGYPRLRDAPVFAALWVVYFQWGLPAALVGELAALAD